MRRNRTVDYLATGVSVILYSMPSYLLGLLLIAAFAANLHLLPAEDPQASSLGGLLAQPAGLVLQYYDAAVNGDYPVELVYGAIAGYPSGLTYTILMRVVDVILAVPIMYLFVDLASIFRPTLLLLVLVLALLSWVGPARLVRGETLSLRTREYVQAARAMGEGTPRIAFRHLVPNAIGCSMPAASGGASIPVGSAAPLCVASRPTWWRSVDTISGSCRKGGKRLHGQSGDDSVPVRAQRVVGARSGRLCSGARR